MVDTVIVEADSPPASAVMASAVGGHVTGRLRLRWARTANDEVCFRDIANDEARPGSNPWLAPLLGRLFRPDHAVLIGGTSRRAAGVFAGARDLAAAEGGAARDSRS